MTENILKTLKEYYANLLIIQYNGKPKASQTIKMIAYLTWANMVLLQIRDAFDWKTATGQQLDIIGKWVGVDKYISRELYAEHSWFSLIEVSGPTSIYQGGFSEVSNFDSPDNIGGFLTPDLVTTYQYELPLESFRFLVGLKIIKNNISHYCKDIDDAIYKFSNEFSDRFNNGIVKTKWDLANKQLIYKYTYQYEELMEIALIKNVLPCPPTVSIKLEEI